MFPMMLSDLDLGLIFDDEPFLHVYSVGGCIRPNLRGSGGQDDPGREARSEDFLCGAIFGASETAFFSLALAGNKSH